MVLLATSVKTWRNQHTYLYKISMFTKIVQLITSSISTFSCGNDPNRNPFECRSPRFDNQYLPFQGATPDVTRRTIQIVALPR
jgi:hypothetical protein